MNDDEERAQVRIQAAADPDKQQRQLSELLHSGMVNGYAIVARLKWGGYHVIGLGLHPATGMTRAFDAVVHALKRIPPMAPTGNKVVEFGPKRTPEAVIGVDGLPEIEGETTLVCGECHNKTWFVLHFANDLTPARYKCTQCGNEVKIKIVSHGPGVMGPTLGKA
jgi:hypothetical protein